MSYFVKKSIERISEDNRKLISKRYCTVTAAINAEFWGITNDRMNSLYVGSYGRGTAIKTSDIDILVKLPYNEYVRYNSLIGNGQSRLLQSVKKAIMTKYPRSEIRADGQIVKIKFSDGIDFEILPAFLEPDNTYKYPDTNMGGHWKSTNPKAEQEAMKVKNKQSNGLLVDTCKHLRSIRDEYFSSYHLSGIVIDSVVYNFIGDWHWCIDGEVASTPRGMFEKSLCNYVDNIFCIGKSYIYAPGSQQEVSIADSIDCLRKVISYMI